MTSVKTLERTLGIWLFAALAVIFGLMTLKSGYSVLFIDGEARIAAGHYVPFVLWFNFLSGFVYIITAIGLWLMKPWSAWLSLLLTASILLVFSAFGIHVYTGGEYELRTVLAMLLRSAVWIAITFFSWQHFFKNNTEFH